MTEAATPTAETPTAASGDAPTKKEDMYRAMADLLNAKVHKAFEPIARRASEKGIDKGSSLSIRKVFGDNDARDLTVAVFDGLTDILFQTDGGKASEGSVGIPAGFGSLQLTTAAATTKRTPQGNTVEVPERWRVKWSPGKAVDEKLAKLPAPAGS